VEANLNQISPLGAPEYPARLKVSSCGCLYTNAGSFEWDDYLRHKRIALGSEAIALLATFSDWQEYPGDSQEDDTATVLDPGIIDALLAVDILVVEGSERHRREEFLLQSWAAWGPSARHFHYATRSDATTEFISGGEQKQALIANLSTAPPPPAFKPLQRAYIPLPTNIEASDSKTSFLIESLKQRRSERTFNEASVPLIALATLLKLAAGVVEVREATQTVFKHSPSGGGRHPTEVYICAKDVDGLPKGIYRYAAREHGLEPVGALPDSHEIVEACGGQTWMADANLLVFYTSVLARNAWKYKTPRSYRTLLLDVGHLDQTLLIVAATLGLRATFTAALQDEAVERLLGCDPTNELVIGCAAIGAS
jgi:SagB-type dehydrogenase family enzyme